MHQSTPATNWLTLSLSIDHAAMGGDGRNWVSGGLITLVQPDSPADCFRMLMDGQVELVALNEFTGRAAVSDLNLSEDVVALQNPITTQGLHAVVHRTHPRATVLMNVINTGLRRLNEDRDLDDIIANHLSLFYLDLS